MLLYDIQLRNPNRAVHIRFDGIGARGASLDSREYRVVNTELGDVNLLTPIIHPVFLAHFAGLHRAIGSTPIPEDLSTSSPFSAYTLGI